MFYFVGSSCTTGDFILIRQSRSDGTWLEEDHEWWSFRKMMTGWIEEGKLVRFKAWVGQISPTLCVALSFCRILVSSRLLLLCPFILRNFDSFTILR